MDVVSVLFLLIASLYLVIFLVSTVELLYSYILSKKGKLQISFRLGFLLLVILLCALRVVLLSLSVLYGRLDAFMLLQANILLISFGNFFFFCAFYSVILLFVRALKIQTGTTLKVVKIVSFALFIMHGLSQLVLSMIFAIRLGIEHGEIKEAHPEHVEGMDDLALLVYVSPWLFQVIVAIVAINGIFTFFLSIAFLVLGIKIWHGLKEGSRAQNSTDHSYHGKLTLVNKMLLLTLVVSFSLVGKGIYSLYISGKNQGKIQLETFVADFFAEIIPLMTFQLVLYLSRREINSSRGTGSHSHSHSYSNSLQNHNHPSLPHGHHHREVSPEGKAPSPPSSVSLSPTSTELLNANEWLKVLTPPSPAGEILMRIERLEEEDEEKDEEKEHNEDLKKELRDPSQGV